MSMILTLLGLGAAVQGARNARRSPSSACAEAERASLTAAERRARLRRARPPMSIFIQPHQ
jgi:hypothetical protein